MIKHIEFHAEIKLRTLRLMKWRYCYVQVTRDRTNRYEPNWIVNVYNFYILDDNKLYCAIVCIRVYIFSSCFVGSWAYVYRYTYMKFALLGCIFMTKVEVGTDFGLLQFCISASMNIYTKRNHRYCANTYTYIIF